MLSPSISLIKHISVIHFVEVLESFPIDMRWASSQSPDDVWHFTRPLFWKDKVPNRSS